MPNGLLSRKSLLSTLEGAPPEDSAVDQAVRAARFEFAFGSQPMSLTVAIVLAGMTVGVLRAPGNETMLLIWFAGLFALNAARFVQYR